MSTYVAYHIWRLRQYLKKENRQLKKDIASNRFGYRLSLVFAFFAFIQYNYVASAIFVMISVMLYIYRDYCKGYHVGWKRRMIKEHAKEECDSDF